MAASPAACGSGAEASAMPSWVSSPRSTKRFESGSRPIIPCEDDLILKDSRTRLIVLKVSGGLPCLPLCVASSCGSLSFAASASTLASHLASYFPSFFQAAYSAIRSEFIAGPPVLDEHFDFGEYLEPNLGMTLASFVEVRQRMRTAFCCACYLV